MGTANEVEPHYQPEINGPTGVLHKRIIHDDHDDLFHYFDRHNRYSDWEALLRNKGFLPRNDEPQPGARGVLKRVFARLPCKGSAAAVYSYALRLGFLDGSAGLQFAIGRGCYYWQVGLKQKELRRRSAQRGDRDAHPMMAVSTTALWPDVDEFFGRLACPSCGGPLRPAAGTVACTFCGRHHPVKDGIPLLLPPEVDRAKLRQRTFFDDDVNSEWEITRPAGAAKFHRWLLEEKFRQAVAGLQSLLRGGTVLVPVADPAWTRSFLRSVARESLLRTSRSGRRGVPTSVAD